MNLFSKNFKNKNIPELFFPLTLEDACRFDSVTGGDDIETPAVTNENTNGKSTEIVEGVAFSEWEVPPKGDGESSSPSVECRQEEECNTGDPWTEWIANEVEVEIENVGRSGSETVGKVIMEGPTATQRIQWGVQKQEKPAVPLSSPDFLTGSNHSEEPQALREKILFQQKLVHYVRLWLQKEQRHLRSLREDIVVQQKLIGRVQSRFRTEQQRLHGLQKKIHEQGCFNNTGNE